MRRIVTIPALKWIPVFIVLDLVGVGIVGDFVARHAGFSPSVLMPVSALICVAAGYTTAKRGMWGATAGSLVTAAEMIGYLASGGLDSERLPAPLKPLVSVVVVMAVSVGGALLGAIGDWIVRREMRRALSAA